VLTAEPPELPQELEVGAGGGLDEAQLQALLDNRFVVVPASFATFDSVYRAIGQQDLPQFVTSDFVLHSFQVVSDVAWQRAEAQFLPEHLTALSAAMVEASQQQWEAAESEPVSEAARFNLAFFTVAHRLLVPSAEIAPVVSEVVNEELTLIEQGGTFISPLFQRQQEYGRYIPTGHYAGSEPLSRYYQAMVWLSQPFTVQQTQSDNMVANRQVARKLLLMVEAVTASENLARWERVYQPAAYFGGRDGGWDLAQVIEVAEAIYVDVGLHQLQDVGRLDNFLATLRTLPSPSPYVGQSPQQFSFMPAHSYPDQSIFRRLLFNNTGAYQGGDTPLPPSALETSIGAIRALPRALDVPAVLGSKQAAALLEEADDTNYEGFPLQFQQLTEQYAALEAEAWAGSAHGAWLYALQPLLAAPLFVQNEAWQNKQLNSWFGAWVEMRHETTLGPRPIEAAEPPPEATFAYLEPQPLLYGRLAATAGQMVNGLESRGLLEEEAGQKLRQMEQFLEELEGIAMKELAREPLDEDETRFLNQAVPRLTELATFDAPAEGDVPQIDAVLPRLVDVYRDPSSGRLTQMAVGKAWPIYVLLLREEQPVMVAGAVYSTYELLGEQLRADEWQTMEERPGIEAWSDPYLTP
jgi:hypothetical protein